MSPVKNRFVTKEALSDFTADFLKTRILSDSPFTTHCMTDLKNFMNSFADPVDLLFFHNWLTEYIYETILMVAEDAQILQISPEKAVLADFFSDLDFGVYEQWGV